MKRILAIGTLVVALVAACGSDIQSGRVTGKTFKPDQTVLIMMPMSCGKSCFMTVPEYIDDPACWGLELINPKQSGSVCVDPTVWNDRQVGELYP